MTKLKEVKELAEKALKLIESMGWPVYKPFDELMDDAHGTLTDAIKIIGVRIEEE